jgi:hypothetical protein
MSATAELPFPLVDLALARRLERTEARSNAEFVEARGKVYPETGATWIEVAGAYAMFDGVSSPCTQTFGLGVFQPPGPTDLETIEAFFRERGAPVFHEVSPIADGSLLELLNARGYQPIELTSVLYRPIRRSEHLSGSRNDRLRVRVIDDDEQDLWAQVGVRGWSATGELADFLRGMGRVNLARPSAVEVLGELDGEAIAAGSMTLWQGVALMAGACTVPEGRRQGAQLALLERRLQYAAEQGCDLAMMGAAPGSGSQRNAERHGFRIAYTRIKWRLAR